MITDFNLLYPGIDVSYPVVGDLICFWRVSCLALVFSFAARVSSSSSWVGSFFFSFPFFAPAF